MKEVLHVRWFIIFKGKLLLHMVCSLGSHVEINLTDTCNSTKEQHMLQGLAIQEVCRVPSLVCLTWLTMLFILVQCAKLIPSNKRQIKETDFCNCYHFCTNSILAGEKSQIISN